MKKVVILLVFLIGLIAVLFSRADNGSYIELMKSKNSMMSSLGKFSLQLSVKNEDFLVHNISNVLNYLLIDKKSGSNISEEDLCDLRTKVTRQYVVDYVGNIIFEGVYSGDEFAVDFGLGLMSYHNITDLGVIKDKGITSATSKIIDLAEMIQNSSKNKNIQKSLVAISKAPELLVDYKNDPCR